MQISTQPVRLVTYDGDGDAILIFRNGDLLAVASRLSDLHGELSGSFFIEAVFGPHDRHAGATFDSETELHRWAESLGDGRPEQRPAPLMRSNRS
jgi:hypothetical protein